MDKDIREHFWKAFQTSPFIMMSLQGGHAHAEPMTAQLDKDAHHAIWFFTKRDNRIGGGGKAMGQVMTRGHEVFACIDGTLVEETDTAVRDREDKGQPGLFRRSRYRHTPTQLIANSATFCSPIPSALSSRNPQATRAIELVTKMTKPQPVHLRPRSSDTISAATVPAAAP